MAEISFDIGALYEKAFGYKTQAFNPEFSTVTGYGGVASLTRTEFGAFGSEYYAEDALGREYYMPVKLSYPDETTTTNGVISGSDGVPGSTSEGPVGVLKDWYLPYPVISISSRKTIVETVLTERRGTAKELINIQDYEIVVKGFIIGNGNEFPEKEVTELRAVYEQNTPLSIQCPLTDIFLVRPDRSGSDQVVIRELKFPVIPGVKHVRPYELHMVSDEPFNLITIS